MTELVVIRRNDRTRDDNSEPRRSAEDEEESGRLSADLHYIAADLLNLAEEAPPHKRDALVAIHGMITALAED